MHDSRDGQKGLYDPMTTLDHGLAALSPAASSFLARHGHAQACLEPLAGDASPRRYFRLPEAGLLLMEDHQDPIAFTAYLRLSYHLSTLGLSAPIIHGAAPAHGLALVEDFGHRTYTACLGAGEDEHALYALAVDALLYLHHHNGATQVSQPVYEMATLLDELDVFCDWLAPAVNPAINHSLFARQFRTLWAKALTPVAGKAETLVLRDFHVDNLMLLPQRQGVARCGLLDFQDAVLGPCEYDLVSLLQDARRDLAPGLEQQMLERYISGAPERLGDAMAIRRRYALLGAQRHTRIAGTFLRLSRREGKSRYLGYLPRVLVQLENSLACAGLTDITDLLNTRLPGWQAKGAALGDGYHDTQGAPHD
ncbi:aminoglycoside phosphotransferase family protein [Franzmannia qiaohouensis]|uniref:Phosphotransferase n=1 Tax=Franzmannia qiaohouensis TaxID=1329370 RepID=A0ABU1HKE7_9GAMM|nr:phosphotransferase [Halomonas qiaohouensis]MDR5907766.1 phosphotransferase [Halomonas qiaohouensis]